MKITNVDVRIYGWDNPADDVNRSASLICLVETDAGITGTGEAALAFRRFLPSELYEHGHQESIARIMKTVIESMLVPLIEGQRPYDYERLWDLMFRRTYGIGRRGVAIHAIAAIDVALWNIMAQAANLPLYKYLGAYRERVRVYANCAHPYLPPEPFRKRAREYVDQGFVGIKIRGGTNIADPERATELVRTAREAIGPDAILMVDCNGSWPRETAIRTLKKWEPYDLFWVEEPILPDDYDGFAVVAASTRTPLVTGEQHSTRFDFRQLMLYGGVRILQPDVFRVGGITEFLKIAHAAEVFGLPIAPHAHHELHAHLSAAIPNFYIQEYFVKTGEGVIFDVDHSSFDFDPETSTIRPLQDPGTGTTLRPEADEYRLTYV